MYGMDMVYLPRVMRREDSLYMEDVLSQFTQTYNMEMYIKNVQGWEGAGNYLSKFGLQIEHTFSVWISRERFSEIVRLPRPTEGDWVYVPAPINKLFEIKFVENEKAESQFYTLGTRTFYELTLELYTYSHEEIRTGNTVIDSFETEQAYAQELVFASGTGTFGSRETVFQGESLDTASATGVVATWTANTSTLKITDITGVFADGIDVIGATSGARYLLGTTPDPLLSPNDPTHDNVFYETEYDEFVVGQQKNPFGG